ncbi:bifunctional diaminohydroxyphosphoribosylaminopyrimidine deaminase/5-amino-6-(5-phosphoribosylamino)uracil reductase RibD [Paenalcaligenes sp. Me131]|uniref:bifunctional diaminohydroxyphosphoribosylaminopyrimidine deaminase/5-amino-6-(5-phosphoribosylamino)uracil reductase RibD n=1 Tax=Paenalcaligenes sp. Me131 TaxID=3392636 RepID=UPI003D2E7167
MDDVKWMQQALAQAQSVMHLTSPNPRVGCVIVQDDQVVAAGATQQAGGPHAEVMALAQARERQIDLSRCTVYVTLEPCSHYGRTPPCVQALIQARPQRVVVALLDPNPLVAGRGIRALQEANIPVQTGVCADAALEQNPGFVSRMLRKQAWLWLKLAGSLDGRSALLNGQSQWITGPEARQDGHQWRARSCVVLTGIGTVLADNPLLNVRGIETPRQPIRAVVDTHFRLPIDAKLLNGDPVWVFTASNDATKAKQLADNNVQVIQVGKNAAGHADLAEVMAFIDEQAINEVHVEAGGLFSGAMLQTGRIDQIISYVAPTLLGPGQPIVALPELQQLSLAQRFEFHDAQRLGKDVRLLLRDSQRWNTLQEGLLF